MRIRTITEKGSSLLVTLVVTTILGFSLASYLDLVSNQNLSVMRSTQWNGAIPVLESGLEEALTHLFHNPTNRGVNGWLLVNGLYRKERAMGENKYVVTITTDNRPVVEAFAFMRKPLGTGYLDPPRAVRVTLTNAPTFARGMVAKGEIDLSGNRVRTDSFDSSDPLYSTNGRYDENKAKDNGDVATNSSVIDTFNVWNADIFGKAATGPGGNVRLGQNGAVGSRAWHEAGNQGIEPGWSNDDMNVFFRDVEVPFQGGAFVPSSGTVNGIFYKYVVTSGNWELSSLSLSGSEKMLVSGDAVVYVKGNISVSGLGQVVISDTGSLQMYAGGASTSLGGRGVMNTEGLASNFYYYGLPSNKSIALTGNASFTGAIYAPQAALTLGGGGEDEYDFSGASVSASVKINGKYKFHYDENLASTGPKRGYTIEAWNEIFGSSAWTWSEM